MLGECQVTNGQLQITADQSEDIVGLLIGAPYASGHGTMLYAAFKAKFLTLPNSNRTTSRISQTEVPLRGRIYPYIPTNAPFGCSTWQSEMR